MNGIEVSRELRHELTKVVVVGWASFLLGQMYSASMTPHPIVVKVELPFAIAPEEIGDRSSLNAAMPDPAAVDLAQTYGGGVWSCPVRTGEGSWK